MYWRHPTQGELSCLPEVDPPKTAPVAFRSALKTFSISTDYQKWVFIGGIAACELAGGMPEMGSLPTGSRY